VILGCGQTRSRAGNPFELGGGRECGLERSRKRTLACGRGRVEDQLPGHPGDDLHCGLDADKARVGLDRFSDRSAIGGRCVHRLSLSGRGPWIKPRPIESLTTNMIALVSATAIGEEEHDG
jgi:hypothetical protein